MRRIGLLAWVALTAVLIGCEQKGLVVGPYLANPGQTEMTVLWIAAHPEKVEFRYGPADGPEQPAILPPPVAINAATTQPFDNAEPVGLRHYVYKVHLTGLKPGTAYRYTVAADGAVASADFRTWPRQSRGPFTFAAYGDSRTGIKVHTKLARLMAERHPSFIVHTGDFSGYGSYQGYLAEYFAPLDGLVSHVPVLAIPGNHEKDRAAYQNLFPTPGNERWSSFDYANVHFAGMDSTLKGRDRTEMFDWLAKDLADSKADWKIVFYHYPTYDLGTRRTEWARKELPTVLRRGGVDLVLNGHVHSYQRLVPMFTPGENEAHPITYIVTAGGGAGFYQLSNNTYGAVALRQHHFMMFTVDGQTLTGQAINVDGQQIDSFQITKKDGRLDPAYLALALPEDKFDEIYNSITPFINGVRLPRLPQPGEPVTLTLPIGAGKFALTKFKLNLESTANEYTMAQVRGSAPANGTCDVTVTIFAKQPTTCSKAGFVKPGAWFDLEYEINGMKGQVRSDNLLCPLNGG